MAVGTRAIPTAAETGGDSASASASLHSQAPDQEVVVRLPGMERATIYAAVDDVAAWPTDLVLTVERSIVPGVWRGLATPATIGAVGATDLRQIGPATALRVRGSTRSTAGHGRVRVAIMAERSLLLGSGTPSGSTVLYGDDTFGAVAGGSGLTHPQVMARGLGA